MFGEVIQGSAPTGRASDGGRGRPMPADGFHEAPPLERARAFLSRNLLSPLQGLTFGDWCELVVRSGGRVDPAYWPRMLLLGTTSLLNSAYATIDRLAWGCRVEAVDVPPPLFILGHYRSGTTHLQNLLALDPRFAFPTVYQAFNPRTFLSSEAMFTPTAKALLVRRRPQDNVALAVDVPTEDEMALCTATFLSPYMSWVLPRSEERYDRYLAFRDVTEAETARWKAAFLAFVRKLTYATGRPLVLKSPPHTARIPLLLELFPDARFVLIRREPYTVFRSTRHLYEAVSPYFRLQHPREIDGDGRILATYRTMLDAYFDDRPRIPAGRLVEVGFEDLERDPIGRVRGIYESLGLPPFDEVEVRLQAYLDTISGYRKSTHPDLPGPLRDRIATEWRRSFEAWDYPA